MSTDRVQVEVQDVIDELITDGSESGLQVAVINDGQVIVDAVGGLADPQTGVEVTRNTLFYATSTAKGVASSLAHVLVEQRVLAYDMRVADVWPEFASKGKHKVTLRHVLLHTAGVPGLPANTTVENLCDWDYMCAAIADEQPWWEPGAHFGYHAQTFGFLLGETLSRATGRTISTLLRDEVTAPLGIEDEVHFGVPERLVPLVARQVAPIDWKPVFPEPGSPVARAIPRGIVPTPQMLNRADVLKSDIPSGGTMTARGVARLYAALLGHVDGIALVSSNRLALMAEVGFTGMDEVMGIQAEWSFGYSPARPGGFPSRPGSTFGMVGANGSAAYADIDSGIAVAVMRNRFAVGDLSTAARIDRIVAEGLA